MALLHFGTGEHICSYFYEVPDAVFSVLVTIETRIPLPAEMGDEVADTRPLYVMKGSE